MWYGHNEKDGFRVLLYFAYIFSVKRFQPFLFSLKTQENRRNLLLFVPPQAAKGRLT